MRHLIVLLFFLAQISCKQNPKEYTANILKNGTINTGFFQNIGEPERALLGWYLFAYGNECTAVSQKQKCQLLNLLKVENECDEEYTDFLKKWFTGDLYRSSKLINCPNMPYKGAIQNRFKKIIISRRADTISISFKVDGLNESQEKSWNVEQEDVYVVREGRFVKVEK
ncbi:MAG TPA: hypothetical protein ENJ95_12090 [Bacteroidetes bacterium]|nr:hypothetical protein [Bacteroidota bacterium]